MKQPRLRPRPTRSTSTLLSPSFLIPSLFSVLCLVQPIQSYEIDTGGVQIKPPKVSSYEDMYLTGEPVTPIPVDGSFVFVFPEALSNFLPAFDCILEQPPERLTVDCDFKFRSEDKRLVLTASGFSKPITSFFSLLVPDFVTPRSTTPSRTFQFQSFDADGKLLDFQHDGIQAQAADFGVIKEPLINSSNEIVHTKNNVIQVTFQTLSDLKVGDQFQLQIPKLNPYSRFPNPYINYRDVDVGRLECSGVKNVVKFLDCELIRGVEYDILSIKNPVDKDYDALETLVFKFGPVTNPITTSPRQGFLLRTMDKEGGTIAEGFMALQISQQTTIPDDSDQVSLQVSDDLILEQADFRIEINLPVPLEAGCQVQITLPRNLVLSKQLTKISTTGMFGSQVSQEFTVDANTQSIKIVDACPVYRENLGRAVFLLSQLQNPSYVVNTESFIVEFADKDGNPIAVTSGGVNYTTRPGSIGVYPWAASNYLVTAQSNILFAIQPEHSTTSADVKVEVILPSDDFEVLPDSCLIYDYNKAVDSSKVDCQINNKTQGIELTKVLREPYQPGDFSPIEFGIMDIKMPSSTRPTGVYKINFYDNIEGKYELVDTVEVTDMLRSLAGELKEVFVKPNLNQTYFEDIFDFEFLISHPILKGGSLQFVLPSELSLIDDAECIDLATKVFDVETRCLFDFDQNMITIVDAFPITRKDFTDVDVLVTVSIFGIFTPRQVKPTSNFQIKTMDSKGYTIDAHSTFSLAPLDAKLKIENVQTRQESDFVGDLTSYEFFIRNPLPLFENDVVYLKAPAQAGNNLAYTFRTCSGSELQNYLAEDLHCVLEGLDGIKITVKLNPGKQFIPANAEFGFKLEYLKNPQSTKPSDAFYVQIRDMDGFEVTTINEKKPFHFFKMRAEQPADLIYAQVRSETPIALDKTLFDFMIVTKHLLPVNSTIDVYIPKEIGINEDSFQCWINTRPDKDRDCTFNNKTRIMSIHEVNTAYLVGGTTLNFEIKGLTNPEYAKPTQSFRITTKTSDGYLVDAQKKGLTIITNCDYPCTQCAAGEPSQCRKCHTDTEAEFPLYFENQCLKECPSNYYPLENICSQCDAGCLECEATSKLCLKCHAGLFLHGNTCLDTCPDTHFGNSDLRVCERCEGPCETCSMSRQFCETCDQSQPLNLFFNNTCNDKCPVDVSVFHEGQCIPCSENCQTCADSFDTCTTCADGEFLDKSSFTCVAQCPADITVPTQHDPALKMRQSLTCEQCNDSCFSCSYEDIEYCEECREGFKMVESTHQCRETCPISTAELYIPLTEDTICMQCNDGCATCEYERDHCTTCLPHYVFYQYQCMKECPIGFTVVSDEMPTCVQDGEVCPFGYEFNSLGACALSVAHCNEGYILNPSDDKCVPVPGFHLPFAFLYAAIIWLIVILRKKHRSLYRKEVLVSQILVGFTLIQSIGYFVLFLLAFPMGYDFIIAFHTIGLFAIFFLNVASLIAFLFLIEDSPFKHWQEKNQRPTLVIFALQTLVSFKATRLFYCRLFQKDFFNAAFEDRFRAVTRPLFVLSMLGLLQAGPILYVNVYSWFFFEWGYELKTLAIENTILGLVIFVLEIYEFVLYRSLEPAFLGVRDYLTNPKSGRGKKQELQVMGAFEDDSDDVVNNVGERRSLVKAFEQSEKMDAPERRNESQVTLTAHQDVSQVIILEDMIKKINEKQKLKELNQDFAVLTEAEEAAMEESARQHTLVKSAKERKKIMREKRQKFEKFRHEKTRMEDKFADVPDISIEPTLEQASNPSKVSNVLRKISSHQNMVSQAVYNAQTSATPREHSGSGAGNSKDTKSRKSGSKQGKGTSLRSYKQISMLEKFETRSAGEVERDKQDFDRIYEVYKQQFDEKAKEGTLVPNMRLHQSFDEDVLRELYDGDFGVCSDFQSELSWISYPPLQEGFWQNNPYHQTKVDLFREKVKSKFNYANVYMDSRAPKPLPQALKKPSRRTQTFGNGAKSEGDFDPFASDDDYADDTEDQFSHIDPQICQNIMNNVFDGISDGLGHASVGYDKSDLDFSDMEEGKFGKSKKRKRDGRFQIDAVVGDLQVDSFGQMRVDVKTLRDNQNRKVTAMGYLTDEWGNITNADGEIVFTKDQLAANGDIPEEFQNEQRKKQQLTARDKPDLPLSPQAYNQNLNPDEIIADDESKVGQEMERLANLSMDAPTDSEQDISAELLKSNADLEFYDDHSAFEVNDEGRRRKKKKKMSKRDRMLEKAYKPKPRFSHRNDSFEDGSPRRNGRRSMTESQLQVSQRKGSPRKSSVGDRKSSVGKSSGRKSTRRQHLRNQDVSIQQQPITGSDLDNTMSELAVTPQQQRYVADSTKKFGDRSETHGNLSSGVDTVTDGNKDVNSRLQGTVDPSVGVQAQQFLNQQWDSETSNSQNQFLFGSQPRTIGRPGGDSAGKSDENEISHLQAKSQPSDQDASHLTDYQQPRQKFDKYQHGYMFNLEKPQTPKQEASYRQQTSHDQIMASERGRHMGGPVPFSNLGVDSKPYKAKRRWKARDTQKEKDQRRALITSGTSRLRGLENIYLRNLRDSAQPLEGGTMPSAYPNAMVTEEYQQAFNRHSTKKYPTTASAIKRRSNKGPGLKKQNFVEDGNQIVQARTRSQARNIGIKRQLGTSQLSGAVDAWGQPNVGMFADQTVNSASPGGEYLGVDRGVSSGPATTYPASSRQDETNQFFMGMKSALDKMQSLRDQEKERTLAVQAMFDAKNDNQDDSQHF